MLLTIIPLATNSGSFARASSGRSTTSNTLDQAAIKSLRQQQERFETSVDSRRAIALALASTEFQQMTSRSIWAFNSIFDRFTFTLSAFGVSVVPQNVNVVYSLVAPGLVGVNIVVTEDPALSNVLTVTTQEVPRYSGTESDSHNYSGYEFVDCHTAPTYCNIDWQSPIYEASANWNMPYVQEPGAWACFNHKCDVATWVGLCNVPGCTDNNIVQGGTDSGVYCVTGCQTYYQAFYEFGANSVYCYYWQAGGGNIVDVYSKYVTTGNPNDVPYYTVNVYSTYNGQSCGTSNNYYPSVSNPHYSEFINERPWWDYPWNYYARLPSFYDGGPEWITSCQIDAQSTNSNYPSTYCSPMYNQGWDTYYLMRNGCSPPDNIALGGIDSSSDFSQTYLRYCGT
ncbi:hypothetical protein E6H36_13010 [Candidatus Bathyarchaeota archaeon]|nr:MAG: hypothetical protein E6H36_13010 [Candidatus Bathyarchaeota archaeon]